MIFKMKPFLRQIAALLLIGLASVSIAFGQQITQVTDELLTAGSMPLEYEIIPGAYNTREPMGLPECERVDDSYFDDAVFIGDSVTQKLEYYVRAMRKENPDFLGKAQFLAAVSMGTGNALGKVTDKSRHPSYHGVKMTLEDAVAACGAKKVFIMLGMNDVYGDEIDYVLNNYATLVKRIRKKSPGCTIFVQSATPRLKGYSKEPTTKSLF